MMTDKRATTAVENRPIAVTQDRDWSPSSPSPVMLLSPVACQFLRFLVLLLRIILNHDESELKKNFPLIGMLCSGRDNLEVQLPS